MKGGKNKSRVWAFLYAAFVAEVVKMHWRNLTEWEREESHLLNWEPSPSSLTFTLWGKNTECWKVCKVYLPLCYHLFPRWPGVFHSHWMYRRSHFHRIWHSDPLWKPAWVLVSGSFQDPPKSLTSLHSWNVWDMVLLRKQEKQKPKWSFWIRTDKCDLNLEHRWNRLPVPYHSCRKP